MPFYDEIPECAKIIRYVSPVGLSFGSFLSDAVLFCRSFFWVSQNESYSFLL